MARLPALESLPTISQEVVTRFLPPPCGPSTLLPRTTMHTTPRRLPTLPLPCPSSLRTACLAATLWALAGYSMAGSLPAAAKAEVNTLLTRLQTSGCDFNRNGSWYTGAEAKAHLLKKLDYLDGKNAVQTTEQFIELGASSSSASGKAYQVRCAGAAAVDAGPWLKGELKAVRSGTAVPMAPVAPAAK